MIGRSYRAVLKLYFAAAVIAGAGIFFGARLLAEFEESRAFKQAFFPYELAMQLQDQIVGVEELAGMGTRLPPLDFDCPAPFSCRIFIVKAMKPVSIYIRFAETASGEYYFSYSDTEPAANGIYYLEENGEEAAIFDFSNLYQLYAGEPALEISLGYADGNLKVEVNHIVLNSGLEAPPERCVMTVEGYGFRIVRFAAYRTTAENQTSCAIERSAYGKKPLVSLPDLMRVERTGGTAQFAGFVFSVVAAAVTALLLAGIARICIVRKLLFAVRWRDLLFLFIPLQVLAAFLVRSYLDLPIVSFLFVIPVVLVVNICLLAGGRMAGNPRGAGEGCILAFPSKLPGSQPFLLMLAGPIAYRFAVLPRFSLLSEVIKVESGTAIVFMTAPLVLGLLGTLVFRSPTLLYSLVFPALQVFFLRAATYPGIFPQEPVLIFLVIFPWFAWIIAVSAVNAKTAVFRTMLLPVFLLLALPGLAELTIRANPRFDEELTIRSVLQEHLWHLADYTSLLGDFPPPGPVLLRERHHRVEKPPGVFRIVCAGSSSTWGIGASSADHTYPAALQDILNDRSAPDQRFEVLNGGVLGAPLYTIRVFLHDILLEMSPDLVVLYFGINGDTAGLAEEYALYKKLVTDHPFIDTGEELWTARHLAVVNRFTVRLMQTATRSRIVTGLILSMDELRKKWRDKHGFNGSISFTLAKTPDLIAHDSIRRGVPLVLVPEVARASVISGEEIHAYRGIFEAFDNGNNVRMIDIEPVMIGRMGEKTLDNLERWFTDEVHLSDAGYFLLADCLAEALIREELLPAGISTP